LGGYSRIRNGAFPHDFDDFDDLDDMVEIRADPQDPRHPRSISSLRSRPALERGEGFVIDLFFSGFLAFLCASVVFFSLSQNPCLLFWENGSNYP
jgi:hypothetical protein